MHSRIVILSGHSLFVEGIATRLQQMPNRVEVVFIDPNLGDYLEQITSIQPSAVLIDAQDAKNAQCCLLCELLLAFPDITLLRLAVDQTDVQVVVSQRHRLQEVQDLIDVFE